MIRLGFPRVDGMMELRMNEGKKERRREEEKEEREVQDNERKSGGPHCPCANYVK